MKNNLNYGFKDFTTKNYKKLLKIAKNNFSFNTFTDFDKNKEFILWRHDVDFSVHRARKLAGIEAVEKIRATYFLHLHSGFYNLFEKEVRDLVLEIIKLGHEIGLHFDPDFYDLADEKSLERSLLFEEEIVRKIFKIKLKAFSFHNPGNKTLRFGKYVYAGMVNVYADYFRKNVTYVSDSNGYWRFDTLEDVLKGAEKKRLQVLTHPGWWQDKEMPPRERIKRCIEGRALKTASKYDYLMKKNRRKNIR